MAELLAGDGWIKANSVGSYLREALPDDYVVVTDARPCGRHVAAAIVGRAVLFVVDDLEPDGGAAGDGVTASSARLSCVEAAQLFLRDEFPSLRLPAQELRGEPDWSSEPPVWRALVPADYADLPLAELILGADAGDDAPLSAELRAQVGLALRDRQLTVSQRAGKPFVFRSGGGFRTGTQVFTVRDAVDHMDRYPADGVQVLRDGTLAGWLEEEGAHHLATLARDVTQQPKADMRRGLETFLQGTGLVARPTLVAAPAVVDLGYVVQGKKASRQLKIDRRGRGFLSGEMSGAAPWLQIEPRSFEGTPAEFVVTVETGGLQIASAQYITGLVIKSNAGEEPANLPVSVRVVAEPPRFARMLTRPLAGMLIGAAVGALWGWLGALAGLAGEVAPVWIGTVALMWGLAGGYRGWRQPSAWPVRFALPRWLLKALGWSGGLGALAMLIVVAWRLGLGGGLEVIGLTLPAAFFAGAAFGFAPATLDELAQSRYARDPEHIHGRRAFLRPVLVGGSLVALLLLALLAPRLVSSAISETGVESTLRTSASWFEQRLEELGNTMDRWVDRATLQYYDRPAPGGSRTPAPGLPEFKVPDFKMPSVLEGD